MATEVELAGGVRVVKADNPPEATPDAAAAGQDPSLVAREPSPEKASKGVLN